MLGSFPFLNVGKYHFITSLFLVLVVLRSLDQPAMTEELATAQYLKLSSCLRKVKEAVT